MTHHELADTLHRAYAGIPEEDLRDLIDAVRGLIAASRALGVSIESYLTVADRVEQTRQSEAAKFLVPLEQAQLPPDLHPAPRGDRAPEVHSWQYLPEGLPGVDR